MKEIRIWLKGTGPLVEASGAMVFKAGATAPKEADSYVDISMRNLGCPDDQTPRVLQRVSESPRMVLSSAQVISSALARELNQQRYCKGNLLLVRNEGTFTIWGRDPIEVLFESDHLCDDYSGWVPTEDPLTRIAGRPSSTERTLVHTMYVLKEKKVIPVAAAIWLLAFFGAGTVLGFTISQIIK